MFTNSLPMSYARRYWGRFLHYDPLFLVTLLVFQTIAAVFYWRFTGWDTLDGGMSWMGEASALLREGKFGESFAPLTSVYLAIMMWLLGETILATKIALLVVFLFSTIAMHYTALRMTSDFRAARISSAILACSPLLYYQTITAGYELPSVLIHILLILAATRAYRFQTWGSAAVLGLVAGLGALVKASMGALGIVVVLYFLLLAIFAKNEQRRIWARCAIAILVFSVPTVSWMARNKSRNGYFALADPAYSAHTWFHGNNPWATKGFPVLGDDATPEYRDCITQIRNSVAPGDSVGLAKAYREYVRQYIFRDPFHWFVVMGVKKIWCGFKCYGRLELLHWAPIVPLAIFGLWALFTYGRHTLIVHVLFLNYVLNTYIFFGFSRYRVAYLPVFVLLATSAMLWFYDRVERKRFVAGAVSYALLFIFAYSFARPLRMLWLHYIPWLRM